MTPTRRRRRRAPLALALAAACASAACAQKEEPGIEVSVDLAAFAGQVQNLEVAIGAAPDGFMGRDPTSVDGVGVTTEDVDGDGALELVAQFLIPKSPVSFRVATGNEAMLSVSGHALAFSQTALMAGADSAAAETLAPGGRASLALTLTARSGGVVGPDTRSTDLKTAATDVTIGTSAAAAGLSAVAVCDVDRDGKDDIVIGAPAATNIDLPVGALYVLLGTNGFGSTIDLQNPSTVMEFHFYGQFAGDQLGAAVACADLNGDGVGDLVVGAPGANGGKGAVYAVFGSRGVASRMIKPGSTGSDGPDITWTSDADSGFGGLLFAADLNGDSKAEIFAASPAAGKVHLLGNVTQATAAPISVDVADHVTFSNVHATSIAAGDIDHLADAPDVVIGDSQAKTMDSINRRGAVYGFPNVAMAGTKQYDLMSADATSKPAQVIFGAQDMQFGAAALALDTTGAGQDLIVGAPGDGSGAGAFYVYEGTSDFFSVATRDYKMDATKIVAGPAAGGRFGAALAGTPTGDPGSASWDLVVGAPGTGRGDARQLVGAAYLFGGLAAWQFPLFEQIYGANLGDTLGAIVAGGQIGSADKVGDLVAVAPNAMQTGVVYVRYDHHAP